MVFNLTEQDIFLIIFFILATAIIWTCLDVFKLLRREWKNPSLSRDFAQNELFLRISEEFKKRLEELTEKEVQKNIGEFKNAFQKTSEEIIKSYKSQFAGGNQEIQREISILSKFTLEIQNKISEAAKNKILELNQAAEKEFIKIQEVNLKAFIQVSQSAKETLSKKMEEAAKEIENYKKERFREIDRKIYQLLGEVAKKTIGKAIDLSDHERLVIEALEKAKKEIF